MIKCGVVFDGDKIKVNDFTITVSWEYREFLAEHDYRNIFEFCTSLEQEIKYCMEN